MYYWSRVTLLSKLVSNSMCNVSVLDKVTIEFVIDSQEFESRLL